MKQGFRRIKMINMMPMMRALLALLVAACLLSSARASAAEYRVSYAFDAGDANDAGSATCEYKSLCIIESGKLKPIIQLSFRDPRHDIITVGLRSRDRWTCCYFADGVSEAKANILGSPIRLNVYVGHGRRGNEYLENEPFGILYLQFLELK